MHKVSAKEMFFAVLSVIAKMQNTKKIIGKEVNMKDMDVIVSDFDYCSKYGVRSLHKNEIRENLNELVKMGLLSKTVITETHYGKDFKTGVYKLTDKAIAYVTQLKTQKVAN